MTLDGIYNQILLNIQSGIPAITNTSNTSVNVNMAQAYANVLFAAYNEILGVKYDIANNLSQSRIGQAQQYLDIALAFQYGDSLIVDKADYYNPHYATIDPSKQIVKQASIYASFDSEIDNNGNTYKACGRSTMNVAAIDNNGSLTPLTTDQLTQFRAYMSDNFWQLGVPINIYSNPGNLIRFGTIKIEYFSNVSLTDVKTSVKKAVKSSVLAPSNGGLSLYNGNFVVQNFCDYVIKKVNGNAPVELSTLQSSVFVNAQINTPYFPNQWQNIVISKNLSSGYFNLDASVEAMLDDDNNYISVSR